MSTAANNSQPPVASQPITVSALQPAENGALSLADRFLGLRGWVDQAAKFGMAGVVTGLLVYMVVTSRQDADAVRVEAKEAHKGMSVMTDVLREERDATKDLTHAIKALSVEVRHLKDGRLPMAKEDTGRNEP